MLENLFNTIMTATITPSVFIICMGVSLILGLLLALSYMYKNTYSKSFVLTLAMLPAIVQVVMMLVNGNLGTGVAVMGAFSLVRFRSVPGSAKEILSIFTAMAVGLATGVGYVGIAILFTFILILMNFIYSVSGFGESPASKRQLKITIPENLDYTDIFDDIFEKYTANHQLLKVKTSNMGSLYQLTYTVKLKNEKEEKAFIDEVRCKNGNLDIISNRCAAASDEL